MPTLLQSIQQLDLSSLQELLQSGIDVNQPCSNGELPLKIAIAQLFHGAIDSDKAMQLIDMLLAAGADPKKIVFKSSFSGEIESLLHFLARQGEPTFSFFVRDQKESPTTHARRQQHHELAQKLIKKLLAPPFLMEVNSGNAKKETPLLLAIHAENFVLAKLLVGHGAKADKPTVQGCTALHAAVSGKVDTAFIQLLLEQKIDLNTVDTNGYILLDMARESSIILLLLKRETKAKQQDWLDFFRIAQEQKHEELIDYLFAQGLATYSNPLGEIALQRTENYSLLERLCRNGAAKHLHGLPFFNLFHQWFSWNNRKDEKETQRHLDLLREYKADFQVVDQQGNTLLHQHFFQHGILIATFLLNNGVKINSLNQEQQTALQKAAEFFDVALLNLLLIKGADAALLDVKKLTALEYIKYQSFNRENFKAKESIAVLMQLLEKYPAKKLPSNAPDLMLIAIHCNHLPLVKELHARGASLIEKSAAYWLTPSELMIEQNHLALMAWTLTVLKNHPQRLVLLTNLLFMAVKFFRHQMIILLMKEGVDINKQNEQGETLLNVFVEALNGHYAPKDEAHAVSQTFAVLLENKIDINQRNRQGQTALQLLLDRYRTNCWSLAKAFLVHGAAIPPDIRYFHDLAIMAAQHQDAKAIQAIVSRCSRTDKPLLLAHLARFAVRKADTALLDQLIALGLELQHPLPGYLPNDRRYLLDEVLTPEYQVGNFSQEEKNLTTEQHAANQQKLLLYLLKKEIPLHYPAAKQHLLTQQCLLHIATARGWVEVLIFLLQSPQGFRADQRAANYPHQTPLQIAVINRQITAAKLLVQHGANLAVKTSEGKTLLHIACENGDMAMVQWLLETNKIDINAASTNNIFFPQFPIHIAAYYQDKNTAAALVTVLLQHGARMDGHLLWILISKHAPEHILQTVLAKLPDAVLLEERLLHTAVTANNLFACKLLLQRCPALLKTLNARGCTPLPLATAPGREKIYHFLRGAGAEVKQQDYQGHDVNVHALCHGTLNGRANLINLNEFRQLRASLVEEKEFASGNTEIFFSLSLYCFNLINLFQTKDKAWRYIQTHQDAHSRQPIHDLCQFQLPVQTNWTKNAWAELCLQHGTKITPFLHWAARIEQLLQRAPRSLEEIEVTVKKISYAREAENPQMAQVFKEHKVPEAAFNRVLNIYPKDTQRRHLLPDIYIDGKEFKQPNYYLKKLPPDDLRGFVLGQLTHCCQIVGSPGEACAIHGMLSPYGGFYVIYKRSKDKEIQKTKKIYQQAVQANSIKEFISQFREKDARRAHQARCDEIRLKLPKDEKDSATDHAVLEVLRSQLKQALNTLQEGEIIAQSWTWISQQRALVLDSWERSERPEQVSSYDELCLPFLQRFAEQAITKHGFKQVLLGKGGQTPADLKLDIAEHTESPRDYFDYRDSKEQYVLCSRAPIKTITPALAANSFLFKPALQLTSNQGIAATVMNDLLQQALIAQQHIQLFPAVDLTQSDAKQSVETLRTAAALVTQSPQKTIRIIPLLTQQYFWTAFVIEDTKTENEQRQRLVTYLDFAAKPLPPELSLHQIGVVDHYSLHTLPAVYNEDPAQSGVWLLETLRHFAATNSLTIPVQNIIYQQVKLLNDSLKQPFTDAPHLVGLILEYSNLPTCFKR